jgi:hypothetical protein
VIGGTLRDSDTQGVVSIGTLSDLQRVFDVYHVGSGEGVYLADALPNASNFF